ncbi:MAG TPA: hypothetical protein VFY67_09730, partial [Pyrinomonadaceae bacterium]|nr:hypothetical protein [Pyrinomonadaceae bacterium]
MKRLNSKLVISGFAILCALGFFLPVVSQNQTTLKDAFTHDFMIGAALNRRQFYEEDTRGAAI